MKFADRFTNYNIADLGYVKIPSVVITDEERADLGIKDSIPNEEFLKELLNRGLKELIDGSPEISKDKKIYIDRTKKEYDTFVELGFVDYVLLVWKVCNFCRINNIMTDFGRGSAAGACSFYCLGITHINPIKYNLYFERFLSAERAKKKIINGEVYVAGEHMPDVDLNVDPAHRDKVIKYLHILYPERVCKILNTNELSGKILIKECGKIVGGKNETEMVEVSDSIPKIFGIVADLEEAYKSEAVFRQWCDNNPAVYKNALKLRWLYKNFSVHASGYVISDNRLIEFMPTQLTADKELVSSYTMQDVSSLAIKLDILGSRASSVVDSCCKYLNLDWKTVNVDSDPIIYDNLANGLKHPHGIFQLEADCNLRVANQIKPKHLGELSDVLALARPGALSFVDKYVKNECEKVHPIFDDILKSTRGLCLLQEQMMQMAVAIGFNLAEANILRKIVGKKKVEEVKEWKEKIYAKCRENGHPESLGDLLWKILDDSAKYSFNKSHSISYAAMSALTIYLKYKHPLQFYISLLNQCKNESNPLQEINIIQKELHSFGIKLLPPNLIKSELDFTIENGNIRYGLSSLKGVSDKTIEKLISFRKEYKNRFEIFESARNCKINIGVLSALIQSGCLDNGDKPSTERSSLVYEAQLYRLLTDRERVVVHNIYNAMGDKLKDLRAILMYMKDNNNEKGKPYLNAKRVETIRKGSDNYRKIYQQNSKNERIAIYFYEKVCTGFPTTFSLRDINPEYSGVLDPLQKIKDELDEKERVRAICQVTDVYVGKSKAGKQYMRVELEDETGVMTGLAFNSERSDTIALIKEENGGNLPKAGDIVYIKGVKKNEESIYLDKCDIQSLKIFTKLSELKNDLESEEKVDGNKKSN